MFRTNNIKSYIDDAASSADRMEDDTMPQSLLNLSAMATAKHVSCEEMERYSQHLDDALLTKVAFMACPQDETLIKKIANVSLRDDRTWQWGESCVDENAVKDVRQVGFMVTAKVKDCYVSFTFEKQQITSTSCDCATKDGLWCRHIIAAILYRIRHSDTVPIHPPVTETLSSLDRNQLQKLLQYAINEDPAGVLGKVFMWVNQIRDDKTEINLTPSLPDPTFGLGSEDTPTWDLTIDELRKRFHNVCQNSVNTYFTCSMEESRIRTNSCYKRFIQKVIDLIHVDQIEAAGQILKTLLTVSTDVALNEPENITKTYVNFLKTLERICSLYIIEFTGHVRSDLIEMCAHLNKTINIASNYSEWAELPQLSLLYSFDSSDEPGIMGCNQTRMFYEPICASVAPDLNRELNELLAGDVLPINSKYDDKLPLMIMKFESLRLWNSSENGLKKSLYLGAVLLRKLLNATEKLTVFSGQQNMETQTSTNVERTEKRKTMDDVVTGIPIKKIKLTDRKRDAELNACDIKMPETTYPNKEKIHCSSDNNSLITDERSETLTDLNELMADDPRTDPYKTFNKPAPSEETRPRFIIDSLGKRTQEKDADCLSKCTLSFCLSHITCCMYEVDKFYIYLSEADREVLASATLRALELTRYRIETGKRNSLSKEEHSALQRQQEKLFQYYKEHINNLVLPSVSAGLERRYMKKLCCCNTDKVCFFDNALPLPLISFLVKKEFQNSARTQMGKKLACVLSLYTVCHSDKPFAYYVPVSDNNVYNESCELHKLWKKSFKDITELFLDHLKDSPEKEFMLTKLLTHYKDIEDENALFSLFEKISQFPLQDLSEDTQIAMLHFLLKCIKLSNSSNNKIWNLNRRCYEMMTCICSKMGSEFVTLVLHGWKEIVTFFRSDQQETLIDKMKEIVTHDNPLSESMLTAIIKFFSGAFKHDVDGCFLLNLFTQDDNNIEQVFEVIRSNSDNFSSSALLVVAEKNLKYHSKQLRRNTFTEYAMDMITCALKSIKGDDNSGAPVRSRYTYGGIFNKTPNPYIQWVFQAFVKGAAKKRGTCRQVTQIIRLVQKAFNDDLQTILSLLCIVEKEKDIFNKCKAIFGERVLELSRNGLLQVTKSLTPRHYKSFKTEVDKVKDYFEKYVTDSNAFRSLLKEIKRHNRSKRKLITQLRNAYDF